MVTRMQRHFVSEAHFTSPYAPKFQVRAAKVAFAFSDGEQREMSVMGKGYTAEDAQNRIYGEAAERFTLHRANSADTWHLLYRPAEAEQIVVPQAIFGETPPSSHGCAAHNQIADAAFAALCELWERRQIDRWWRGQHTLLRVSAEQAHLWGIGSLVAHARREAMAPRRTHFFVVGGVSPISVCAALSTDEDGGQMAIGFSAGVNLVRTLKRSLEELLSVELEVADLHRAHLDHDTIPDESNRAYVARRQSALARIFADKTAFEPWASQLKWSAISDVRDLIANSAALGLPVMIADLTNPQIGIPVCRAMFCEAGENALFADRSQVQPV